MTEKTGVRTKVDVSASGRVEAKGGVARRTLLNFEFLDVLVEAGFVRDVAARQLHDALAAERVLEWLLARGACAPNECSLSAPSWRRGINHTADSLVE